jgi:hypothetical protein
MSKIIKLSEGLCELLQRIKSSSTVANLILESSKEGHSLPVIENGVDYLSISEADSNKISYLNCDRIGSINENDYWSSGKRYHISPGKIISKLFDKTIINFLTPKDVEIFSNVYRSCQVENKVKFEVVKGDDIKYYYHQRSYNTNINGDSCGSLGGSCMKHDRCQDYFSIYIDNKEVSLLCLLDKNNNSLIGRALLWDIEAENLNSEKSTYKVMDRIYTTNDDFYASMFKNWAKTNEYYYKQEQNFSNSVWFEKDGKKVDLYLSVNLNTNYKYFPYLDTFKFIDVNNSTLYNYPVDGVFNLKIMNSTEGYLNKGSDYCFDEITRIVHHRNDTTQLRYLNDIRVYNGTVYHSYIHDCYILKSHAQYDYTLDDYLFNEEYDRFNDKEKIELVLAERKKQVEQINKKREILKSLRNETPSINDFDDLDDELNSYSIRIEDPLVSRQSEGRAVRDSNIVREYVAGIEPQPTSMYERRIVEDNESNNEDEAPILTTSPRRRTPSSRRGSGYRSPGVGTSEVDINYVAPSSINETVTITDDTEQSLTGITTNFTDTLTSDFDSIWSGYLSSIGGYNTGRIYPDMTAHLQELVQQISINNQASIDESDNNSEN